MYYKEGRPFYLERGDVVHPHNCEDKDFGSPSGHMTSSATIMILIFLQYFDPHDIRGSAELLYRRPDRSYDEAGRDKYSHPKNRVNTTLLSFSAAVITVITLLSWVNEMMSGSNSLDQVIFGTSLGLGMCFTWYMLRDDVCVYYLKISEHADHISEWINVIFFALFGTGIAFGLWFASKWYVNREFNKMDDVPPEWVLEY